MRLLYLIFLFLLAFSASVEAGERRTDLESAMALAIAEVRDAGDLAALAPDTGFAALAFDQADAMAAAALMAHRLPGGDGPGARVKARFPDYRGEIAENVGKYTDLPDDARDFATGMVGSWLASPPHRAALLNPAYRCAGIGAVTTDSAVFVALMLGSEPTGAGDCRSDPAEIRGNRAAD